MNASAWLVESGIAAMPPGSEAFKWKLFPNARRCCRECGLEQLRIVDVAEHRTHYPSNRQDFLCRECMRSRLETAIAEERSRGAARLPARAPE